MASARNLIRGVVNSCITKTCGGCAHAISMTSANVEADNEKFEALVIPNPANNSATLHMNGVINGASIRITDIAGKVLWHSLDTKSAQINLPVEKLSAGIYFVVVTDGKRSKIIKLVKE